MSFIHDLYKGAPTGEDRKTPFYFGDKAAYVSPMSRTVVEGRTAHREHMKQHGVVEAGDMKLGETSAARTDTSMGDVRTDITRSIQELNR